MENQKDKEAFNKDRGAFIALYWGQEVLINSSTGEILHVDQSKVLEHKSWSLLLKSLENISDEDLVYFGYDPLQEQEKYNFIKANKRGFSQQDADYLRSKSYLIGFREYSIEQILDMKWAEIS